MNAPHESAAVRAAKRVTESERELTLLVGRLALTALYLEEKCAEQGALKDLATVDKLVSDAINVSHRVLAATERLRYARSLLMHHVDRIETRHRMRGNGEV